MEDNKNKAVESTETTSKEATGTAITAGTVIRTLILIIALVNQCLTAFGKSPLPFSDTEIQQGVTLVFTIAAAIAAWWKNNSFTEAARAADLLLGQIRNQNKR